MPPNPPTKPNSKFSSMKGHHVALRVPDFEESKRWFVEKLDFRVLHEWPDKDKDLRLAYLAPANDDSLYIEIIGGGSPNLKREYTDRRQLARERLSPLLHGRYQRR